MTDTIQIPDTVPAPAASTRVTIDDVRAVVADPNSSNANKVRTLLGGRGSFETIQKHLNTMRQELAAAAAPPVAPDQIPAAPAELISQIWASAWTAAQASNLRRAELLAAERDAALLTLKAQAEDLAGNADERDSLSKQLEAALIDKETADVKLDVTIFNLQHQRDESAYIQTESLKELDRVRAAAIAAATDASVALANVKADAEHASQIAEAGRDLMRQELARLTDQIGEMKAHLYKRADSAPAPSPDPEVFDNPFPAGQ